MLYRTNIALAINGDRVEKGTEIELSREQAAQYHKDDLSPVGTTKQEPEPEQEPVALDDMSLEQLRDEAKERGLSTSGSKAALLERIKLQTEGATEDTADEEAIVDPKSD